MLPAAEHGEVPGAHFAEALAIVVALGGLTFAWVTYQKGLVDPTASRRAWPRLYALSKNKFYIDELYDATIVRPLLALARGALRFDLDVIDGIVNGVAENRARLGRRAGSASDRSGARLPALHGARPCRRSRRPVVAIGERA